VAAFFNLNLDRRIIFAMTRFQRVLWIFIVGLLAATEVHTQGADDVIRLNAAVDDIVPAGARVEKLAEGFDFLEGPVWVRKGGYLLFSDIPANVIDRWTPDGKVSVFLKPSGFTGTDLSQSGRKVDNGRAVVNLIGSNAVTLDRQGRVVFCAQGDRAVVRLEKDGQRTVLADRYDGKRLNSPNDLVYKSDGALYFTDPPAGLPKGDDDPKKELPFDGVYLLIGGKLQALDKSFLRPNGLAFAPGEKYFYVNDSFKKTIMRFEVQPDDTIANGHVFIDMNSDETPGVPDGMKVDRKGNVYCTGPGGVWVISSAGKHLATIRTPERITNLAFGNADGKMLYLTGRTGELYGIHLKVAGIRP
jgi:gluconolactonase